MRSVAVVAATNRPDLIDPALLRPGRIDRLLYVTLPDAPARREILGIHLRSVEKGRAELQDVVESVTERTEGYSGAELAAVCREACLCALRDDIEAEQRGGGSRSLCREHFEQALLEVRTALAPC